MKNYSKDKVYVYVRVKPYVYKFFVKHFNSNSPVPGAVKFPKGDEVYTHIRNRLRKPHNWYTSRIQENKSLKHKLAIELVNHDFEKYGFELSINDEKELSTMLESRVQKQMILWVAMRYMVGFKLQKTCELWQEENNINEDDWSSETMRRMCTRAGVVQARNEYLDFMHQNVCKLFSRFVE